MTAEDIHSQDTWQEFTLEDAEKLNAEICAGIMAEAKTKKQKASVENMRSFAGEYLKRILSPTKFSQILTIFRRKEP